MSLAIAFAAFVFYFSPAFIAVGKQNTVGIAFINLLFGWTVIGWIAAFIWACVSPKVMK